MMMKRILTSLTLIISSAVAVASHASAKLPCDSSYEICDGTTSPTGFTTSVTDITALIMYIVGALSVIMIIFAGISYATAAGDEQKTKTARHAIIYSLVGLGVAILAHTIASFVFSQVKN
jgi:hypothetical protein